MKYEDFIEEAYEIGLDGVKFPLYWLPTKDPSYSGKIKRLSLYRGLSISEDGLSTNFCFSEVSERKKAIEAVKEGLEITCELRAPCLRVFGGYVPKEYSSEDAINWIVESIK